MGGLAHLTRVKIFFGLQTSIVLLTFEHATTSFYNHPEFEPGTCRTAGRCDEIDKAAFRYLIGIYLVPTSELAGF